MLKKLSRFLFGTLRGRLILGVAAVHAVMMALFIADLTARQGAMLMERQTEEATALSQSLATSAAGWIVAEDVSGLQELVELQRRQPEVLFVILADREGRVLADTDRSRLGLYLRDLPREVRQTVLAETPALVDVAVPAMIGDRHVGWARAGLGQNAAVKKLAEITRDGVAYALGAILLGSFIAWFLGRRITRRLYAIQETFDAVRSGNSLARSRIGGSDEAAVMAAEFNGMLDALAQRDADLRASEERSSSLIQKVQAAIVLHDGLGRIEASNPMAQALLGLSGEQLLGRTLIDPEWHFLREDGSVMPVDEYPVSKVLLTRRPLRDHVMGICRPDREGVSWVLVNAEPDYDAAGNITRVVVSFVDITERKRAEEERFEQQQVFRTLVENSPDIIARYDRDCRRIYVNPAYLREAHIPQQELLATDPVHRSPLPPAGAAALQSLLRKVLDSGVAGAIDVRWPKADKIDHWYSVYASPEFDREGRVASVITVSRDITERKQAEEDVRRLNERFSLAARAARLGVWDWDLEKNQLVWDDGMYALYGVGREDFAGAYEAWLNGLHPDDRAASDEMSKRAQRGECEYDTEFRVVWPDGSVHHLKAYGQFVRDADGKPLRMTGVNYDITERKRAEEQLRHSERGLSEAQRIAHLGNWELDLESNALTWSDEIFRIFEIAPEQFGASYEAFLNGIHPDDRDLVNKAYTDSVKNRLPYDIVHRLRMPDGRIKYVNEKCETYYAEDGKPLRSVGTVHDITERKRAEEALHKLNQELEQRVAERTAELEAANKELEAFAYSVSHDLRAPLRHIDGFVDMLVSHCRDGLSDQGLHYVGVIASSARRMGILIDDLLQFSRTGRAELRQERIDMNQALEEALGPIKESNAGRNIEWVIGKLPPVRGDAVLLRQVWANLLENAVKFTRTRESARIEAGAREENGETVFHVADNGVGFDMQYVGKLFGVFQRLHSQEEFEGTGIGLATVQRILTRHGGRVWAEAGLNQGATFYFALPRIEEKSHA